MSRLFASSSNHLRLTQTRESHLPPLASTPPYLVLCSTSPGSGNLQSGFVFPSSLLRSFPVTILLNLRASLTATRPVGPSVLRSHERTPIFIDPFYSLSSSCLVTSQSPDLSPRPRSIRCHFGLVPLEPRCSCATVLHSCAAAANIRQQATKSTFLCSVSNRARPLYHFQFSEKVHLHTDKQAYIAPRCASVQSQSPTIPTPPPPSVKPRSKTRISFVHPHFKKAKNDAQAHAENRMPLAIRLPNHYTSQTRR